MDSLVACLPAKKRTGEFAFTFELPFHRADLWREIHAEKQLGVHPATNVVTEPPSGSSSSSSSSSDPAFIEGTLRTVSHGQRRTVSRLVASNDDELSSFEIWELIVQEGSRFTLVGGSSGIAPRTSVYLADVFAGKERSGPKISTAVTLGFDYEHAENREDCMSFLWEDHDASFRACFDGVSDFWLGSMLERGYTPIDSEALAQNYIQSIIFRERAKGAVVAPKAVTAAPATAAAPFAAAPAAARAAPETGLDVRAHTRALEKVVEEPQPSLPQPQRMPAPVVPKVTVPVAAAPAPAQQVEMVDDPLLEA